MPDNLTIQISADTGKARADLELLKGKLQELGREMRAARAEAMKTGDRTNLDRLAKDYETVSRSAKGLQQQLRATNAAVASPAWGTVTKAAAGLNAELLNLAKSGLGLTGIGIGAGLIAAIDLIGKTVDQLLELRRVSQATGFSPGAIKALNETLEDTGQEAGAGNKALIRLSQSFGEVRQAARLAGESIGSAQRLMRGGTGVKDQPDTFGVDVRRGGQLDVKPITNAAEAFAALRVDMKKFKDDAAGNDAALQKIIDGFARLQKAGRIDEANLVSMQLFGKGLREILPALKDLAQEVGGLKKAMDELRTQGRFPDEAAIAQAIAYHKELKNIGDAWDSLSFSLLNLFGAPIQVALKGFAAFLDAIKLMITTMVTDLKDALPDLVASFDDMFAHLARGFTELGGIIAGWARSALDAIKSVLAAIGPAVDTAASAGAGSSFGPGGFAGGGVVRGPGTGTSDSILARLSAGEFVMRARAVEKFGPRFFAALNSLQNPFGYHAGGLVRGFAGGGMVTATTSDGVTVNLHFPGGSFALRGDAAIVGGLTREARRAGMLSAGRLAGALA